MPIEDVVAKMDEYVSSVGGNGWKLFYLTSYWTSSFDQVLLNYLEDIIKQFSSSESEPTTTKLPLLAFRMERFSNETDHAQREKLHTKILPDR